MKNILKRLSLKSLLGLETVGIKVTELWIDAPEGARIYAHVHKPESKGPHPGVVIVPGAKSAGTDYDRPAGFLIAADIARAGFAVIHYDPAGRGRTEGVEDFWGVRHQEELKYVVEAFAKEANVDGGNIGLFSFSIGIVIATGSLARFKIPDVKYLFDWEGPSNRFNATKSENFNRILERPVTDDYFWDTREACNYIKDIECGYFRYQGEYDHVQGAYRGHAVELLNGATNGKALWTQCNDNPLNTLFDEARLSNYKWVPRRENHKKRIIKYLRSLSAHTPAARAHAG